MFYWISEYKELWSVLRLFEYVTFRAGGAAFTAMLLTMFLSPLTIRLLKKFNATAPCRFQGLMDEKFIDRAKDKTPSMGGILIIGSVAVSSLLWNRLDNNIPLILLGAMLLFAILGFVDDFAKAVHGNRDGIPGKFKLLFQFLIAGGMILLLNYIPETKGLLQDFFVPFFKGSLFNSPWTMLFSTVVVVGASNAVNLTDGKDGLATGCSIMCAFVFAVFAYFSGHIKFAEYLNVPFMPGISEAVVFASALSGACLGFLWYNCYPASIFMGDTGSLALGGTIGLIAVLVRQELLLAVVGGVFVLEAVSVIIQVTSFKLTGKRVFLCTPIHHHFEQKGWTETQIVVRFWILASIFALMALGTLKLR
ncbi:MAG: phospho-N-acetylmuramoyl-pentapeptide-transferase [Victivallaceae bacterium]|nr:phospho-N-acetylmuramoyl-pentapeptide-transferase [Victivallaceae bacterium]